MSDTSRPPTYSDPYGGPRPGYGPPEAGGGYPGGMRGGGGLTPRRVLKILRRKWRPILGITALGAAGTIFYFMRATPIYQAASMIEISLRSPRILAQSVYEDFGMMQPWEEFNTRLQKLSGSSMMQRFVAQYREMYPEATEPDAILQRLFAQEVDVSRMRNTDIVTLSLEHDDPEFVARVVNAYAMGAEIEAISENSTRSDDAVNWLQEQADLQRTLVAEAEARLVEYRAENQIDSLEAERKSVEASILSLNELSVDIESRMVMLEDVAAMLEAAREDTMQVISLPEDLPGKEAITEAYLRVEEATAQRNALLEMFTDQHPEVSLLSAEIDRETQRFLESVERTRRMVTASLELKRNQIESLRKKLEVQGLRAADLELETVKRKSEYNAFTRERDAREVSYNGILRRIEEARLAADENTSTVRVLELASTPEKPVWPAARRVFPLGILLGLLVGCVVGYLADLLDDRVVSVADVETDLGLKVLGVVPHAPMAEPKEIALASLTAKFGQVPEVFAGIRSLLDCPQVVPASQVVLMSSFAPEEGKTICSSNLAIMCARSKQKTLLIDFDLRAPCTTRIYADAVTGSNEDRKKHSLLHVLADGDPERFSDLPLPGPCENLDIVTSQASQTHSPADIIGGRSVCEFMDWARERYDRIIIDSAPLGVISDASVLSRIADCVVIVCRPERTRKRVIRHGLQQFRNVGANVAGLIANDVDLTRRTFTGDDPYHYHQHAYHQSYAPPVEK